MTFFSIEDLIYLIPFVFKIQICSVFDIDETIGLWFVFILYTITIHRMEFAVLTFLKSPIKVIKNTGRHCINYFFVILFTFD